ncbi:glycosyltransferase [Burkholderia multivorans]|nr:glycosyltransferase [Burkholderia multivorans]
MKNIFDSDWYLREYPDVAKSGLGAHEHYIQIGRYLGRKPGLNPGEGREVMDGEKVRRCDVSRDLVAVNELQARGERQWESLGEDPFFFVDLENLNSVSAGWYEFSVRIDVENFDANRQRAKFYVDTGNNFNENETVIFQNRPGERVARLYKVEGEVTALRFDPMECRGKFKIAELTITNICDADAIEMLASRLIEVHPDYRGASVSDVVSGINSRGKDANYSDVSKLTRDYYDTFSSYQGHVSYVDWIEKVESRDIPTKGMMLRDLAGFKRLPVISVVIPVYNTPERYLRECIDSILDQAYPYWELCIADDASPQPHVASVLREYEARDPRIKVAYRETNGHISEASNSALSLVTGEYVALVDHDDIIPSHALYFVAKEINRFPEAQIFYTDEDKLDKLGKRVDPHFKPDWSPDLFFSQNYVSHLGVYKSELLGRIGGFRKGVEGSQDQDLLLRCLRHTGKDEIVHIPRVLYHWRVIEGSTALASGEKSYTTRAGIKALVDFFSESEEFVSVEEGALPNTYKVLWPIPSETPKVSLIIPTRDRRDLLETAVRSILQKTDYSNYEVIIIDNGSVEPETLSFFGEIQSADDRVSVRRYDFPFNYSSINNYGVKFATGSIIGLINNDVEVISENWLTEMVRHACRKDIGCVGAKLYYSDSTIQHAGVIMGMGGVANHAHKHFPKTSPGYFGRLFVTQNFSAVTAACLLVRKNVYEEVGGLNEDCLAVAFNDIDFCLKVKKAGYRNVWTPYAELFHHESVSRGSEDNPEKIKRFASEVRYMEEVWSKEIKYDPFYNVNLTLDRSDYSLKM